MSGERFPVGGIDVDGVSDSVGRAEGPALDSGIHVAPCDHVLIEQELLVGETVIRELRGKLRIKLKLSKGAIDEIESLLRDQTVVKTPTAHLSIGISDPDDEWIVAEAMAGEADALVTGDAALQKLGKRAPLPIVSPRGLWETLRGAEPPR